MLLWLRDSVSSFWHRVDRSQTKRPGEEERFCTRDGGAEASRGEAIISDSGFSRGAHREEPEPEPEPHQAWRDAWARCREL